MRKIKEVLRLMLDARLSHEQIAAALDLSKGVVSKYVGLAAAVGLDWAAVQALDDVTLERRLLACPEKPRHHVQPDFGRIHHELRRKGVTLMLLWEEYLPAYRLQSPACPSQLPMPSHCIRVRPSPDRLGAIRTPTRSLRLLDPEH